MASALELLNNIDDIGPEGEWLLSTILGCNRIDLYIANKNISREEMSRFNQMLEDILEGRPIQYVLGKTEFMGLEFIVNPDVFIPRPETEILVEKTIELTEGQGSSFKGQRVLDIGTGPGNIAISLAKFLPLSEIVALDISPSALEIAKLNARLNNLEDKIKFIEGNIFHPSPFTPHPSPFDLIVSNPPYIPTGKLEGLPKEVKFEPTIALDGGRDGLAFYRRIINESRYYLKYKGYLIMELGQGQTPEIHEMIENSNQFRLVEVIKDYRGIERVIVAQKHLENIF